MYQPGGICGAWSVLNPAAWPRDDANHSPPSARISFARSRSGHASKVALDGEVVSPAAFSPIGASGFAVARVELATGQVHQASSSIAFGIVVHGYGNDTSYMYRGGLDLKPLNDAVPK